jgi:hypothetical protein
MKGNICYSSLAKLQLKLSLNVLRFLVFGLRFNKGVSQSILKVAPVQIFLHLLNITLLIIGAGMDGSAGIVTRVWAGWLSSWGFDSCQRQDIFLWLCGSPSLMQWVLVAVSPGLKWQEHEADNSCRQCCGYEWWSYRFTPTSSWHVASSDYKDIFTLFHVFQPGRPAQSVGARSSWCLNYLWRHITGITSVSLFLLYPSFHVFSCTVLLIISIPSALVGLR